MTLYMILFLTNVERIRQLIINNFGNGQILIGHLYNHVCWSRPLIARVMRFPSHLIYPNNI